MHDNVSVCVCLGEGAVDVSLIFHREKFLSFLSAMSNFLSITDYTEVWNSILCVLMCVSVCV